MRVWSWPGNTADVVALRPGQGGPARAGPWVASSGSPTAALPPQRTAALLRRGDDHYILAEKLRGGSAEAKAALARAGRYRELAGGLRVKEVRISR